VNPSETLIAAGTFRWKILPPGARTAVTPVHRLHFLHALTDFDLPYIGHVPST